MNQILMTYVVMSINVHFKWLLPKILDKYYLIGIKDSKRT